MLQRLGITVSQAAANGLGNRIKHRKVSTKASPPSRSEGYYYAVKQGFKFKHNYLYTSWSEFQADTKGQRNGIYWPIVKKFRTKDAARAWQLGAIPAGPQVSSLLPDSLRWDGIASNRSSNYPVHLSSGLNLPAPVDSQQSDLAILRKLEQVRSRGFITTEDGALVVYTDGSCKGNRMPWARAGCGVWWGHYGTAYTLRRSERLPGPLQTSTRAELIGIIRALEICPFPDLPLEIRTDSRDCIDCIHSFLPQWLERGSLDLHEEFIVDHDLVVHLLTLLSYRDQANGVRFKHVKAHSGEIGNEWADYLASEGTRMIRLPDRRWLTMTDLRRQYRCDATELREAERSLHKDNHSYILAPPSSAEEQVRSTEPRTTERHLLSALQSSISVQAQNIHASHASEQSSYSRAAMEGDPLSPRLDPNTVRRIEDLKSNINVTDRPIPSNKLKKTFAQSISQTDLGISRWRAMAVSRHKSSDHFNIIIQTTLQTDLQDPDLRLHNRHYQNYTALHRTSSTGCAREIPKSVTSDVCDLVEGIGHQSNVGKEYSREQLTNGRPIFQG